MRNNVPLPVDPREDIAFDVWRNSGKVGCADSNQTFDTLQDMDRILQKYYNLEVVIYDSGGSEYWFTVESIVK